MADVLCFLSVSFPNSFWQSCSACGLLAPWTGIEPAPLAVKAYSPNHWTAGISPNFFFLEEDKTQNETFSQG